MVFDVLAWLIILAAASVIGAGVLTAFGAYHLRLGDRVILGAWLGVVLLALGLLALSVVAPLSPLNAGVVTAVLVAAGWMLLRRNRHPESRRRTTPDVSLTRWEVMAGVGCVAMGAAAFASDPVTLYDALVYHVGIMRWLREHGTVAGVALVHNRLAHVSAWFTLGAPFDAGAASGRVANIPLGVALLLVAGQFALAVARFVARRATGADVFLGLSSAMLIWVGVRYNAATSSPDVATNALICIVAWSLLVLSHVTPLSRVRQWQRWLTPRLLPFVLAVGASAMKLFAVPAAVAAALFYTFAPGDDRGAGLAVRRAVVCVTVALVLMLPFLGANIVASGCALFPSPIGCLPAAWSVGGSAAADYADYIRDVARFEIRRAFGDPAGFSWVGPWVASHPVVFVLIVVSPVLAGALLAGPRRGGVRSALLVAILGLAFAAWQAPAPRFLFAFAIIAPLVALSFPIAAAGQRGVSGLPPQSEAADARGALAFLVASVICGSAYAVASQKVNILSAMQGRAPLVVLDRDDLVLPARPAGPTRLYRWRVNDVDVFTPVPRPVADTLGYTSTIDGRIGFEKCSTAPLPCTPYLPPRDVHLRVPSRGIAAGFVRRQTNEVLSTEAPRCLGELSAPFDVVAAPSATAGAAIAPFTGRSQCGDRASR